jgi:hypothetical protein
LKTKQRFVKLEIRVILKRAERVMDKIHKSIHRVICIKSVNEVISKFGGSKKGLTSNGGSHEGESCAGKANGSQNDR